MWILGADASEEDGEQSVASVSQLVEDGGGKVTHAELWGRRTLAYSVRKNVEGTYCLARFAAEAGAVERFNTAMSADQSIIRHLVTKLENSEGAKITPREIDVGPPERARRGGSGRRP